LDLGGIPQIYSRYPLAVRIDYGDTVVWYGSRGTHHHYLFARQLGRFLMVLVILEKKPKNFSNFCMVLVIVL